MTVVRRRVVPLFRWNKKSFLDEVLLKRASGEFQGSWGWHCPRVATVIKKWIHKFRIN
jgi:hypothetical protein